MLENFSGPFDVLLGLIAKHRLDLTEISLARVTDEFLAYVAALRSNGAAGLEELSNFLVVASTLLDLKTSRLLPVRPGEAEVDLELLEARDLLFARLLQYRAYKTVSGMFGHRLSEQGRSVARDVELEERFHGLLPPLVLDLTPADLAAMCTAVYERAQAPIPVVEVDHVHRPRISLAEQRRWMLVKLAEGPTSFSGLTAGRPNLVVVVRFLILLELFKAGMVELAQPEPLGDLRVLPTAALLEPDTHNGRSGEDEEGTGE
ncbi:segregation/condensation protein A [Brevibacterium sp. 50QC2O2]|uniref:segregation and condensation protein A n=1 Tax=Brevibacterium TaxID=1696 RepID=UPI00211C7C68|nr:segregation/condensation protein A [Brevibacterium sp. 50QC2O2]